jgi:hypothetical protein
VTQATADDFDAERTAAEAVAKMTPAEEWYHYTTIAGLKGILDTAQLWGTHIAYLNDLREVQYGIEALAQPVSAASSDEYTRGRWIR